MRGNGTKENMVDWDIDLVKQELRGPSALVMAPFKEDLSINEDALRKNISYMLDAGIKTGRGHMICPCGTGEYLTLSEDEHQHMVRIAIEISDGQIPVVAGVAGIDIRQVIAKAQNARKVGAKYTMVAPPFYDSIDQDGIYEWYRILNDSLDMGIMIYDQSWRTDLGTTLGLDLIERLAGLDNIVSLKYGSPNIFSDTIVALERFSDRFAFIDNSLGFTAAVSHMHGGTGFISAPVTWWPKFELEFFHLMEQGRYLEADRWHARMAEYMAWFQGEFAQADRYFSQAALVKASLEYVGLYGGPLRPPFRPMNTTEKEELFAVMDRMSVSQCAVAVV